MKKVIDFIKDVGKVKKVKRAGWVREGIANPESVADHSFRVAVMAMVFGKQLGLDADKLVGMALVHDIAEGIEGDKIVERGNKIDKQTRQEKDRDEIETLKRIFQGVEGAEEFIQLQQEIADGVSPEAKILKQLERLEMAVQALEYEEEFGKDLSEFFENASLYVSQPYLRKLLDAVKSSRPNSA